MMRTSGWVRGCSFLLYIGGLIRWVAIPRHGKPRKGLWLTRISKSRVRLESSFTRKISGRNRRLLLASESVSDVVPICDVCLLGVVFSNLNGSGGD